MKSMNILIIDDDSSLVSVMRDILELKGFKVFEADNGLEGLQICGTSSIDLIVLDLNMPRMDGYLFMERLKERWEKERHKFHMPKILVLSVVEKHKDLGLAKSLGASKFMNKPFKSSEFLAAINEILDE